MVILSIFNLYNFNPFGGRITSFSFTSINPFEKVRQVPLGGALGELPTAERYGHEFVGWFTGQI